MIMTYDPDDSSLCLYLLLLPWAEFCVQIQVQISDSRYQISDACCFLSLLAG